MIQSELRSLFFDHASFSWALVTRRDPCVMAQWYISESVTVLTRNQKSLAVQRGVSYHIGWWNRLQVAGAELPATTRVPGGG